MTDSNPDSSNSKKPFNPYSLDPEASLPIFSDDSRFRSQDSIDRRVVPISDPAPATTPLDTTTTTTTKPLEGEIFTKGEVGDHTEEQQEEGEQTDANEQSNQHLTPYRTVDDLPSTIAGPIKCLQYSAIKTRANLIEQLVKTIPHNEYGFPVFIYRPDFLDPQRFQQVPTPEEALELQELLTNAIFQLNYGQGFPVQKDGMPLWSTLPWESLEDYHHFTEYLEQVGVRSLHSMEGLDAGEVLETFTLNYWAFRTKAYDRYHLAHAARQRAHRIVTTENNHYDMAEKLLAKIKPRFETIDNEEIQQLPLTDAVKIASELVKIQRLSAGLPASGVLDDSKNKLRRREPIEVEMRREAQLDGATLETTIQEEDIDILRDNPELAEAAQNLLLQLSTTRNPPKINNDDGSNN